MESTSSQPTERNLGRTTHMNSGLRIEMSEIKKDSANNMFCWLLLLSNPRLSNPRFICPEVHCVLTLWNLAVSSQIFFTRPLLPKGVESTSWNSVCLFVCLSVRNRFNISNIWPSNHPRIMSDTTYYTSLERGWHQRRQWQWQRHTQRQIRRQRQRQIQNA